MTPLFVYVDVDVSPKRLGSLEAYQQAVASKKDGKPQRKRPNRKKRAGQ